jgi:hypothetical protein
MTESKQRLSEWVSSSLAIARRGATSVCSAAWSGQQDNRGHGLTPKATGPRPWLVIDASSDIDTTQQHLTGRFGLLAKRERFVNTNRTPNWNTELIGRHLNGLA